MTVDVLIIGAGIVGCALAESCVRRGMSVLVMERDFPGGGATAAGMGHLVVLDDNPAEMALSHDGVKRWQKRQPAMPRSAEYRTCGTLWLARCAEEMGVAERKLMQYQAQGIAGELIGAKELHRLEPNLVDSLHGALHIPGEAVIYPPVACQWLLDNALEMGATVYRGASVVAVDDSGVVLAGGQKYQASKIVIAAGCQSVELLPELPLVARKGQLVITERYPQFINHQLVELGYLQSAHNKVADSVAFNVQPRATGQILIGSSRQYNDNSQQINWQLLTVMLNCAFAFLPELEKLQAIRSWCGFRPATPDKLPLLGKAVGHQRVWLATGHEGLGITTALSSAELLAALLCDEVPDLDPAPFQPGRFTDADSTPSNLTMDTAQ